MMRGPDHWQRSLMSSRRHERFVMSTRRWPRFSALIRFLEGVRLACLSSVAPATVTPNNSGLVEINQPHLVESLGLVRLQVDFYSAARVLTRHSFSTTPKENSLVPAAELGDDRARQSDRPSA